MIKADGTIRRSKTVLGFGPGAMIDLPEHAILMSGLDYWAQQKKELMPKIDEPRLQLYVQELLKKPFIELRVPPTATENDISIEDTMRMRHCVTGWQFPSWGLYDEGKENQKERDLANVQSTSARMLVRYENRGQRRLQPMRFVRACVNGHLDDINWHEVVHKFGTVSFKTTPNPDIPQNLQAKKNPVSDTASNTDPNTESFSSYVRCAGNLWLDERGTSGDLSQVFMMCDACQRRINMAQLHRSMGNVLGVCEGKSPWLGADVREDCRDKDGNTVPYRLLVRGASQSYFSVTQRVISIPPPQENPIVDDIRHRWEDFEVVENEKDVAKEMRKAKHTVLRGKYSDAEIWQACQVIQEEKHKQARQKAGDLQLQERQPSIKEPELDVLCSQPDEDPAYETQGGTLSTTENFYARNMQWPPAHTLPPQVTTRSTQNLLQSVERVVLVHRLREVVAQVGFTRFEPMSADIDGNIDDSINLRVKMAKLASNEIDFVPAIAMRGEGFFVNISKDAMRDWQERLSTGVKKNIREKKEKADHRVLVWKKALQAAGRKWCGSIDDVIRVWMPYLFLHTLSHAVLTSVALESGYPISAISERIYADDRRERYGFLLYTGTAGARGTLGGLVESARYLDRHLEQALTSALCSNDPTCAAHEPQVTHGPAQLYGAACHGCLFIAEPSCECRNDFLDRSLLVPTVEHGDCCFYEDF